MCRSELRRWPPASGVCVGQKGEEGEGGFSSEKRERQRLSIFWNDVRFSVLICGCKSSTNNCTGAIKFKNQNYVPNTIFFTILNSNQDSSSNFNKVKNHETKTKNEKY